MRFAGPAPDMVNGALPKGLVPSSPPEPVAYATLITSRPDEVVFIAATSRDAAALRDYGLVAVARPDGGKWSADVLAPLVGREVAVLCTDPWGFGADIPRRDTAELRLTARRVGVYIPGEFSEAEPPADVLAWLAQRRAGGFGLQTVVLEALDCLEDTTSKVEPPDPPESEWPPLRLHDLPPVEPFPVDVLPEPARRLVVEGAAAIGCPPDFLGLSALGVAAGAVGRSVRLLLRPNHFAGSSLFTGSVGPPSDGKSPALRIATAPLRVIDTDLAEEHDQAVQRWRLEVAEASSNGKKPKPSTPAPRPRRIDVDDTTMEALLGILADNPRGVIMVRDELTALVLGMNQYKGGRGSDRAVLLKFWSGDAATKDRVGHEGHVPIRCPHPCVTIVGGLTPDMLGEMVDPKGRADGFLDRFLLAYPDPLPVAAWVEAGLPDEVADDWATLVKRLWDRPLTEHGGRPVPHVARLTPSGRAEWQARYDNHAGEMNSPEFPCHLRGAWGKLREYAGRLALILALMDQAAGPTATSGLVPDVDVTHVRGAWRLVHYFKSHARRIRDAIAWGPAAGGGPAVKAIRQWIIERQLNTFTRREVKHARRWISDADLDDALTVLKARQAIRRRVKRPSGSKGGRPGSPVYDVNPELLAAQNVQNSQYQSGR